MNRARLVGFAMLIATPAYSQAVDFSQMAIDNAQLFNNQLAADAVVSASQVSDSRRSRSNADEASLLYRVSHQESQKAEQGYISRLKRNNAEAADALAAQMRAHDFGQVYTGIVAPFGLRRGDIGDEITAYTLLGWMIANNDLGDGPKREQVQAYRAQVAAGLAANPKFADPATRAALGEEIVISFVTLHAGWQSARREGKVQQYSDVVATMFQKQTGNDLRQLVLTDRGLEKRG